MRFREVEKAWERLDDVLRDCERLGEDLRCWVRLEKLAKVE